jgi:hypothetical protein
VAWGKYKKHIIKLFLNIDANIGPLGGVIGFRHLIEGKSST